MKDKFPLSDKELATIRTVTRNLVANLDRHKPSSEPLSQAELERADRMIAAYDRGPDDEGALEALLGWEACNVACWISIWRH